MFAILGLGWGEIIVLGVIGSGLVVVVVLVVAVTKGSAGARQAGDEGRHLRIELDRLREENQRLHEEIKRLREQVSPSADTGIKQS
jgi:cell division protein FtsB